MKRLLAGLALSAFCTLVCARPSAAVVESCLNAKSESPRVRYTPIATNTFQVIEDEDAGKTQTVLRAGSDTVGTWEAKKPAAFGLVFNGKETRLESVTRLDKNEAPAEFSPYEAMWGVAREVGKSYICATFNFDGLGKSGSFQNVRGLYLIERGKRAKTLFYAVGKVASTEK